MSEPILFLIKENTRLGLHPGWAVRNLVMQLDRTPVMVRYHPSWSLESLGEAFSKHGCVIEPPDYGDFFFGSPNTIRVHRTLVVRNGTSYFTVVDNEIYCGLFEDVNGIATRWWRPTPLRRGHWRIFDNPTRIGFTVADSVRNHALIHYQSTQTDVGFGAIIVPMDGRITMFRSKRPTIPKYLSAPDVDKHIAQMRSGIKSDRLFR